MLTRRTFLVIGVCFIIILSCLSNHDIWASGFKHKRTGEPISIIKCTFLKTSYFWVGHEVKDDFLSAIFNYFKTFCSKKEFNVNNQKTEIEIIDEKDFSFIITGLNSDQPKLKGNFGETSLYILKKTPEIIYLAEPTPSGNVINYITLFIERNIVIFSKQYISIGTKDKVTAYMSIGYFE